MNTYTQREYAQPDYVATFIDAHALYRNALNTYAFYKTHNQALSEDLVQDTFVKTWKYLVKNGRVGSMKAFLYHVLKHLIVDEYRKHKSTSLETLLEKGFDPGVHTSQRLFDTLDGKKAAELIDRLPGKYQEVVRMRYLQDLSIKEIAAITGQSRNTVAVQSHRGLEKLKKLYREAQTISI